MKIKEITAYLEGLAPLSSQESYDNSGLITGNPNDEVTAALVSLDCTEDIVEEAMRRGCNLIIAHHPIVFKGLRRLTGSNYVERTVIKAIKNDVAIYAIHTNLDNYRLGVNEEIGRRLGLKNLQVLDPKKNVLSKLVFFVPADHKEMVVKAVFNAGGGHVGDYSDCSFTSGGTGTYRPEEGTTPYEGEVGRLSEVDELRVEVLVSKHRASSVVKAMVEAHPYEEVAYELYPIENVNQYEGSGMIGELETAMDEKEFLQLVKDSFACGVIRHTELKNKPVKRIAYCGGSGSFLLPNAKRAGADIFITGDYKYHEFFDAEDQIVIADIGHYESEQFTSHKLKQLLIEKFSNFAVHLTEVNTNPINYF